MSNNLILNALIVSLKVTSAAVILSFIFGVGLARIMTRNEIKFKSFLEIIILLPMFLPPSVVGYILLIIIGRNGLIGKYLKECFDLTITFTWIAGAVAAFIVSLPMMYQGAKGAFSSIDPIYEEAAMAMGANELTIFFKIVIPMSIKNIVSSLIVTIGRAFGEFGATLMVAGNIPGKTQTISVAMYYAVQGNDRTTANILLLAILIISISLSLIQNYILKHKSTC